MITCASRRKRMTLMITCGSRKKRMLISAGVMGWVDEWNARFSRNSGGGWEVDCKSLQRLRL